MQGRIRQVRKMPGDSGACRTMPRQDNQKVREVLRAKHRTGPDVGSFAEADDDIKTLNCLRGRCSEDVSEHRRLPG